MRGGSILVGIILILCMLVTGCNDIAQPSSLNDSVVGGTIQTTAVSSSPHVQKVRFKSESLDRVMNFNIYLPPGYEEAQQYPVLYIIHGYGGDDTSWIPGLGMDKTADDMISEGLIKPLIIVSPQIDNSYGFNSNSVGNYSDYIVKDLIAYVDFHYSTNATREARYIGGLSMGGWAALHNAFLHPGLFSKVGGHSPAVFMDYWANTGDLEGWLYPSRNLRRQRDPIFLAETEDLSGLSVYLDSGDDDYYRFYEGAEALHKKLLRENVKSQYHLADGAHDGEYWMAHMRDYLLFYAGI